MVNTVDMCKVFNKAPIHRIEDKGNYTVFTVLIGFLKLNKNNIDIKFIFVLK